MKTEYTIFLPGHTSGEWHEIDWPEEPGYKLIKALVEPILGENEPLEHVAVLYEDKHRDMFVSEYGHMALTTREPLPRNDEATKIYRNNWLKQHPECQPEDIHWIAGPAILFHRIVWT